MKVVALVSGGKDSCYNMVLCQHYGHEIVALGNLLPPAADTDDLDSYMYQTVGHQVIAAYARCMALPLYRRRITGASADQRLVYEDTEGDEVEDLAALLAYVKERHPEVGGVASGAIASDYQRTRVERVCARLGLVSLAYLWHQPQAALLRRMVDGGIDAVLVKIAAAGLTPARHLGARLADLPAQLHALRRRYGSNVCGEGGEYESLTLDCPLFARGRIVLDSWRAVAVSEDSLAPIALLHPTAFHVVAKGPAGAAAGVAAEAAGGGSGAEAAAAAAPDAAADAAAAVIEVPDSYAALAPAAPAPPDAAQAALQAALDVQLSTADGGQYCSLTASVADPGPGSPDLRSAAGTAAALAAALGRISATLPALGLDWRASLFVHLYVPSMAQFGAANAAYAAVLPAINPPARATVQLGAGAGLALVVDVLFARHALGERRVLHVQSVSEWAPSCIGPYSQAARHRGLALLAGQIALDPPTMEVVGGGIEAQCVRCLVSCQRVAVAVRTDLPQALLWCTLYCSDAAGAAGRAAAAAHLSAFLAGQLDESLLRGAGEQRRRQHGSGSGDAAAVEGGSDAGGSTGGDTDDDDDDDLAVDDYLQPPAMRRHWQPLLTFVTVPELPRGVLVEVQPAACLVDESLQGDSSSDSEDGEDVAAQRRARRAAAAAARPPGSSMPGWIGRVQASSSSSGGRLWSPGWLCKVHACVGQPAAATDWQAAVQAAAQELAAGVAAAGLSPADVAACKVYCRADLLGSAQGPSAEALQAAVAAALAGVQPTVVPVTAVGASAAADAALLLEALAIKS